MSSIDLVHWGGRDRIANIEHSLKSGSPSVVGWVDPTLAPFNCTGNGLNDDTTGFLAACTAAVAARVPVYLRPGTSFLLSSSIPLVSHLHIYGDPTGGAQSAVSGLPAIINRTTDIFSYSVDTVDVNIFGVYIRGNSVSKNTNCFPVVNSSSGPILQYSRIEKCGFEWFTNVFSTRLLGCTIADNYMDNCSDSPLRAYGSDNWIERNFINSTGLAGNPTVQFVVDLQSMNKTTFRANFITCQPAMGLQWKQGADNVVTENKIEAAVGGQTDGSSVYLNQTSGMVFSNNYLGRSIGNPFSIFTGVVTIYDCQEIDVVDNIIHSTVGNQTGFCLFKLGQAATTLSGIRIKGTRRLSVGALLKHILMAGTIGANIFVEPLVDVQALTDAATVTPDLSLSDTFTLSAAGSRTIAAPSVVFPGMRKWIEVLNNTGGAITTTWNAVYNFTGVGGWTDPATTKRRFVLFECRDNTPTLVAVAKASADY